MKEKTHEEKILEANAYVEKLADFCANSKYRPKYHFAPLSGWMNDPNGLIYFKGKYHLFYQHNPFGEVWNTMYWGHATSSDLINFKHESVALAPSEKYDDTEGGGCFSGTSIEVDGQLLLMYTGVTKNGGDYIQSQNIAIGDGYKFVKSNNNPVIKCPCELDPALFRDPKIIFKNDVYYCFIGTSINDKGTAILYKSKNLLEWDNMGAICDLNIGTMWECPDVMFIDDKMVLMISPMNYGEKQSVYLVGNMDFESGKFTPLQQGESDLGFDFYAAQSTIGESGKNICIGWMNSWDWMPWFRGFGKTMQDKFCGFMSLPREITLSEDNKLIFKPTEFLNKLNFEHIFSYNNLRIDKQIKLPITNTKKAVKIKLLLSIKEASTILLYFYFGKQKIELYFDIINKKITLSRNNIDNYYKNNKTSSFDNFKNDIAMTIYIDTSSFEAFFDSGEVISTLMFPEKCFDGLGIYPKFKNDKGFVEIKIDVLNL